MEDRTIIIAAIRSISQTGPPDDLESSLVREIAGWFLSSGTPPRNEAIPARRLRITSATIGDARNHRAPAGSPIEDP